MNTNITVDSITLQNGTVANAPSGSTDIANKAYVDSNPGAAGPQGNTGSMGGPTATYIASLDAGLSNPAVGNLSYDDPTTPTTIIFNVQDLIGNNYDGWYSWIAAHGNAQSMFKLSRNNAADIYLFNSGGYSYTAGTCLEAGIFDLSPPVNNFTPFTNGETVQLEYIAVPSNGNNGPAGVQGNNGSNGVQGTAGNNGLQGSTGSNGSNGTQGATGAGGVQGNAGSSGSAGVQGVQGPSGSGITTATATTTNGTQTELLIGGSTQILLPINTAWAFSAMVVGTKTDYSDFAAFFIRGAIIQVATASTTAIPGAGVIIDNIYPVSNNWSVACAADTSTGALKILVTGATSTTIHWSADVTIKAVS